MIIKLEQNSKISLYEQISNEVKKNILNGNLKIGDALPSIRALSKSSGASIITIKRAYDDLEALGFIMARQAKGYFVSANNLDNLKDIALAKLEDDLDKLILKAKTLSIKKTELCEMINLMYDLD